MVRRSMSRRSDGWTARRKRSGGKRRGGYRRSASVTKMRRTAGGRMGVACHPGPRDPISWVALLGRAESLARYRELKI